MDKRLIDNYIALPLVINVFKQDQANFSKFIMQNIYLDLLDGAIKKATQDFYKLKSEIISKHHLKVKKISKLHYTVNGEIIKYTSKELKELTEKLMKEYFLGAEIEWTEKGWDPKIPFVPPDERQRVSKS